jgi:hypothetical protein
MARRSAHLGGRLLQPRRVLTGSPLAPPAQQPDRPQKHRQMPFMVLFVAGLRLLGKRHALQSAHRSCGAGASDGLRCRCATTTAPAAAPTAIVAATTACLRHRGPSKPPVRDNPKPAIAALLGLLRRCWASCGAAGREGPLPVQRGCVERPRGRLGGSGPLRLPANKLEQQPVHAPLQHSHVLRTLC